MRWIPLSAALACCFWPLASHAEDTDDNTAEGVETITVRGAQPHDARAPTVFTERIELGERRLEAATTTDLLSELAGVHTRQLGGLGAYSTVSIRGAAANQVQFYIDGVPISQARNETVNLAALPVDTLDAIEVYRGAIPITFGGFGSGGVVNLVTRQANPTPSSEVFLSYGSFDTLRANATHSRTIGDVSILAHFGVAHTEGDFKFLSNNGSESDPSDDFERRRRNNDFTSLAALLKAEIPLTDQIRVHASQNLSFRTQGVPPPDQPATSDVDLRALRSVSNLAVELDQWPLAEADTRLSIYATYNRLDFDDPRGFFFGPQVTKDQTTVIGATASGTVDTLSSLPYAPQRLTWFSEASYDTFDAFNESGEPKDLPDQNRTRISLALQDDVSLLREHLGDRLHIVPIVRFHHLRDRFSDADIIARPSGATSETRRDLWSWSLGAKLSLTSWFELRGNIGRYQRPPNFGELFGNGGTTAPNPDLREESAINRDIGFRITLDNRGPLDALRFRYAYFNNDIDNLIGTAAVRADRFRAENFDNVRLRGHELSLDTHLTRYFSLSANYTLQDPETRQEPNAGNDLPFQPREALFLGLGCQTERFRIRYEYNLLDRNFATEANREVVTGREIHNAHASLELNRHMEVALTVSNFTDRQVKDLVDFPLPGIAFYASARTRF